MPKKTIYVREGDIHLWDRAEQLAGGNISSALSQALSDYVTKKEAEMITSASSHGEVTGRWLYVWSSNNPAGQTAWGTEFDAAGTGPHQAQALVEVLKSKQEVRHVGLEERRRYRDGSLEREPLAAWTRTHEDWARLN